MSITRTQDTPTVVLVHSAYLSTKGDADGLPELRHALAAFRADDADTRPWLWLSNATALRLLDDAFLHDLAHRDLRLAREAGALSALPPELLFLSALSGITGKTKRAAGLIAEENAIRQVTGGVSLRFGRLVLAAWRGQQTEAVKIHAATVAEAAERGNDAEVALAHHSLAVLHNGLGNYGAALDAAVLACESPEPPHTILALLELVEAASRADQSGRAAGALDQLASRAQASGTEWELGLAARSRALTTAGAAAEPHYREAIERLGRSRIAVFLARTHLVYGEWLRRQSRRRDAREQLRIAHEQLTEMGLDAFADRAACELLATSEHPRKRSSQPTDELTARELHIARLVATGATSREVGAQLFLSPRTIESHLRSIFRKLDITSRRQLRELPLS